MRMNCLSLSADYCGLQVDRLLLLAKVVGMEAGLKNEHYLGFTDSVFAGTASTKR